MEYINGKDLYQMFNYGAYYIKKERMFLNDINVFPVPDGDTGNNLVQTLRTIVLESKATESFSETLDSISNAALLGARGNSGVIFAQFVNGLQKSNGSKAKMSTDDFSKIVEGSYFHTKASLSNPVEGTIITIMREWSNQLAMLKKSSKTLKEIFTIAYEHIKGVLEDTKKMLNVLEDNDVVDSGALGFVLFVEGIVNYYDNTKLELDNDEYIELSDTHTFDGAITYRYCTEGLVKTSNYNQEKLRNELEKHGDSLIIAEGKSRIRIHIHTNHPEDVFGVLKQFGEIETQKIDDMKLEMNLKNLKQKRVLVTDSIADIDKQYLDDNNVIVIPINITVEMIPYLDKLSMTNELLFSRINEYQEYPKTSTPSIKYINDLFSRLLLLFEEIIVITVSEQLSATHNVIKGEANKLISSGKNITVIDSMNNSATQGLIVKKTVELMKDGTPTKDIVSTIEQIREKTTILVCLQTFKYATMSGRLPKAVGAIGMFFRVRPIMSLKKGKGAAVGMSFSQKGITKKILKVVKKDMKEHGIESYAITHCLNETLATEYKTLFTEVIGMEPSFITEVSAATAVHSGVGTVAIGYIKK